MKRLLLLALPFLFLQASCKKKDPCTYDQDIPSFSCEHIVELTPDQKRLAAESERISIRKPEIHTGDPDIPVIHRITWNLDLPAGATASIEFRKPPGIGAAPCQNDRWKFSNKESCILQVGCKTTQHYTPYVEHGILGNDRCAYAYDITITQNGKQSLLDPEVVIDDSVSNPPGELLQLYAKKWNVLR